jgi:hypothetical protein
VEAESKSNWERGRICSVVLVFLQSRLHRSNADFFHTFATDLQWLYDKYSPKNIRHLQRAIGLFKSAQARSEMYRSGPGSLELETNLGNAYYSRSRTAEAAATDIEESRRLNERVLSRIMEGRYDNDTKSAVMNNLGR